MDEKRTKKYEFSKTKTTGLLFTPGLEKKNESKKPGRKVGTERHFMASTFEHHNTRREEHAPFLVFY